jgi:lactate permease
MLLSKLVGRILTPFCLLVPCWVIWTYAGFGAMLEIWPAILLAGGVFGLTQLLMSALHGPWLVDIAASIATIIALLALLRVWKPKRILNAKKQDITGQEPSHTKYTASQLIQAWLPWAVLTLMVFLWGMPSMQTHLSAISPAKFAVGGLDQLVQRMPPVVTKPTLEKAVFVFNWLSATGTGIVLAGILSGLLMGCSPLTIAKVFGQTVYQVRFSLLTIAAMLGLGFVTRYCGLDATLGLAFARTGPLYPFFGTLVGWIGVASTGADTSSNVLVGSLQKITAEQLHIAPTLMVSANTAGGVMGKMMAAQSVVVASTATQSYGREGEILRFVIWHSLALASLAGLVIYLMAYVHPFTKLVVR